MNEVWKKPPISLDAYQKMVGHEVGVSSWHLVDQNRIDVYADVIEDHQFIHVDPERAKRETSFGNTVAHGFLTMSLLSIMSYEVMPVIEGTTMGVNYGFNRLRFLSPVRARARGCADVLRSPKRSCENRRNCSRAPMSPSRSRARTSPLWSPTGSA
jgi:acyl dehydratase